MAPNESRRHASCSGRNSISRLCRTSMLLGKQLSANAVANETKGLRLFTGLFRGGSACGKCRLHERPKLCEAALPFSKKALDIPQENAANVIVKAYIHAHEGIWTRANVHQRTNVNANKLKSMQIKYQFYIHWCAIVIVYGFLLKIKSDEC